MRSHAGKPEHCSARRSQPRDSRDRPCSTEPLRWLGESGLPLAQDLVSGLSGVVTSGECPEHLILDQAVLDPHLVPTQSPRCRLQGRSTSVSSRLYPRLPSGPAWLTFGPAEAADSPYAVILHQHMLAMQIRSSAVLGRHGRIAGTALIRRFGWRGDIGAPAARASRTPSPRWPDASGTGTRGISVPSPDSAPSGARPRRPTADLWLRADAR